MKRNLNFETKAIKSTQKASFDVKPVSMPLYLSSTYERSPDGDYSDGFMYSRADNPNRRLLESSIAELEQGDSCFAFSSGMAAISAVFQSLKTGDHVIVPDDVYFNIYLLIRDVLVRWGIEYSMVDMTDENNVKAALQPNTALIWVETPSNPQLKLTDIVAIASVAKANNALLAVDNTWPTPVLQNPLTMGADIVVHSTTKYFGGHSDVLGGCVVINDLSDLNEKLRNIQVHGGAVPSPFDCWLITRGIQTMKLRVMAQTKSAMELAHFLDSHTKIENVIYPGIESHPQFALASRQMTAGYGAMMSVLIVGGEKTANSVAHHLDLFTTATSLGGVESLVEHRKSVEGPDSRTPDNLLRISVGLENVTDLIADWEEALARI